MTSVIAYHFTGEKLRDGRKLPKVGKWLVHKGKAVMCESGLHSSEHPFDAVQYAPGPYLHKVECADIVARQNDKLLCRRRRIIRSGDATELLRYFARMQALSVVDKWEAPDIVLDYLMTGDSSLQAAALDAASAAASDAARAAASAAAWAAARAAAWAAARAAARNEFALLVDEFFA